jgi:phosphoglycolate phosphatase
MRIVFDLDGTLIDSAPDIHAAACRVLAEEGLAPMTPAEVRGMIGHGVAHLVGRLLAAHGLPPEGAQHARMTASFTAGYEGAVHLTRPYPGVVPALARLAATGARLGICTNKPHAATLAVLDHLGLGPFGVVVGGDSLAVRKPAPAPLRAALAALGDGPALYVGDSEVDAETAAAAGVPFLLYTEGYRRAPVTALPHAAAFADWGALPDLVARLA